MDINLEVAINQLDEDNNLKGVNKSAWETVHKELLSRQSQDTIERNDSVLYMHCVHCKHCDDNLNCKISKCVNLRLPCGEHNTTKDKIIADIKEFLLKKAYDDANSWWLVEWLKAHFEEYDNRQ